MMSTTKAHKKNNNYIAKSDIKINNETVSKLNRTTSLLQKYNATEKLQLDAKIKVMIQRINKYFNNPKTLPISLFNNPNAKIFNVFVITFEKILDNIIVKVKISITEMSETNWFVESKTVVKYLSTTR